MLPILGFFLFFLTTVYFFVLRPRFDIFSITYFGSCLYFFPSVIPGDYFFWANHIVYWGALLSLVLSSAIFDFKNGALSAMNIFQQAESDRFFFRIFSVICFFFSVFLLVLQLYKSGLDGFFVSKQVQDRNPHLHMLFVGGVSLGLIYSFVGKFRYLFFVFFGMIGLLFASGDRTLLVVMILAIFFIYASRFNHFILKLIDFRFLVVLIFLGGVGIYGKAIYAAVSIYYMSGIDFLEAMDGALAERGFWDALYESEPYHIDSILAYVLRDDFRVDSDYLLELPFQILPFSGSFVSSLHFFSETVKLEYFPHWSDSAGVGASYWAEGYANFGPFGILVFMLIWVSVIYILNFMLSHSRVVYKPMIVVLGVYWGFYIHRNSLFQIISHGKRVFFVFVFIFLISYVFHYFIYLLRRGYSHGVKKI